MVKRASADIRARFGFAFKERQEALGLTQGQFAERACIQRTDLSDIGRARATSDRMSPPIPKRVTDASSRLAPWGRFPHFRGRRRFEDDRDGPVPEMSYTGAGRVASPRLGVGRSGVSIALRSVSSSFPFSRRTPDGVHRLASARLRRGRPVVSALDGPTPEC
jgi:hypothetical protein